MSYAGYDPASQAPPPWPPQAPAQGRGPSRLLPILGAGLGLLGLIVGVAAWFSAAPSNVGEGPVYSEQQVAEAKKAVCDAFGQGIRSIRAAGARKPDNPADPFPVTAVNIRLAAIAVGNSFFHVVAENPAVPSELSDIMSQLGQTYQDIALIQLADGQKADFDPLISKADKLASQTEEICQ